MYIYYLITMRSYMILRCVVIELYEWIEYHIWCGNGSLKYFCGSTVNCFTLGIQIFLSPRGLVTKVTLR